ncbi:MAG: hypothetical protein WBW33_22935, partial [Bryobacteraceae bacterium]
STSAVVFLNARDRGVKQREGFLHMVGRDNKAIAIALREFIPTMVQNVKPFISNTDIEKLPILTDNVQVARLEAPEEWRPGIARHLYGSGVFRQMILDC